VTDDFPCCTPTGFSDEPTYTAAEVKVLTETATRLALELGRREALEEAHAAIKAKLGLTSRALPIIRSIASQPPGATSDATSGVPKPPKLSRKPTVRSNRLPGVAG
jgi:hypothetical protein